MGRERGSRTRFLTGALRNHDELHEGKNCDMFLLTCSMARKGLLVYHNG